MLAARAYPDREDLVLEQVEQPEPGPGDVLIRVAAAGLAPGLFHLLQQGWFPLLPSIVGHEIAGDVAATGADVGTVSAGQRVRVHPNLTCRNCEYCTTDREQMCSSCSMIGHAVFGPDALVFYRQYHNGGLAEYVNVPAWAVDVLPDNVSYDVGAKVHDLANAVRALKTANLRPGSTVVVTAATGTMGTAVVRLAPLYGITRLIAVARSAERLKAVAKLDPSRVEVVSIDSLDADWKQNGGLTRAVRGLVPGGADAVLDFFPDGAGTGQAIATLRNGGTLVHMGGNRTPIGLPAVAFTAGCWQLAGTRNCTRNDARRVLELLGSGAVVADDLITHVYPLTEVNQAVRALLERSEPMWMTLIHP